MQSLSIIVTCEHAGNLIPKRFDKWFTNAKSDLESHLGIDINAGIYAKKISKHLNAKYISSNISRLLVDLNRSTTNEQIFSKYLKDLGEEDRLEILESYYYPYRKKVERYISEQVESNSVLHLSIHTFTPVLHGKERNLDIGILFDPARNSEQVFSNYLKAHLSEKLPEMLVMHNLPYHGTDDGFTLALREKFENQYYMGIEIEINQKYSSPEMIDRITIMICSVVKDFEVEFRNSKFMGHETYS